MTDEVLLTTLKALIDGQNEILTALREQKEVLASHDEFINGNGKAGAKTRLTLLEKDISEMPEDLIGRITTKIMAVVGVPMLIAMLVIIYEASVHLRGAGQ